MMPTYLDRILDTHRARAADDQRSLGSLVEAAQEMPPARGFRAALVDASTLDGIAVIAEVKRRSPSKGALAVNLDPAVLGAAYAAGGAACLSALTDVEFFGGSAADLAAARAASGRPVLRKDFTVSANDVCDARLMGADCVLLIAAALDDTELEAFHSLARTVGLDALVEVHDEAELARAIAVGADLVGVNQRDLITFQVDQQRAVRMAPRMPSGVVRVAESGIRGPADARVLAAAGYHALLVGESLVKAADPAAAVADLRAAGR
ncbi:MAG: indole-3-glycerol-phosphate synthase TrpC [Actinobacteria bacterium]|uniref:indole-3-glycerol-phosphate synthase n=1 Tax=freshwater metagenome TaxID=449393 RepID=A0A6J7FCV7_9ZZZZ|nr:indole-3-glycerol-phosphate synthase TrpC [Actinomycetota bacterium]